MKTLFFMGFLAVMVLLGTADATAQRNGDVRSSGRGSSGRGGVSNNNGVINYQDNSSRSTLKTERDERKKKAEEEAKKKAEEDRRRKEREEREKRWNEMRNGNNNRNTQSNSRSTSGSKTAKGGNSRASKPDNKGGSTDPTTREVTEVMLDAVKTRTVQFDPAEAATQPGMLMLNSPRFDGTQRVRAGEKPIVEPL